MPKLLALNEQWLCGVSFGLTNDSAMAFRVVERGDRPRTDEAKRDVGTRRASIAPIQKAHIGERNPTHAFDLLREGSLIYVRFVRENPQLYDVTFSNRARCRQLQALQAAGATSSENGTRRSLGFLRESILRCQAESYLVGPDPDLTAFTFWASVHGTIRLSLHQRVPFDTMQIDATVDRAIRRMMHLLTVTRQSRAASGVGVPNDTARPIDGFGRASRVQG